MKKMGKPMMKPKKAKPFAQIQRLSPGARNAFVAVQGDGGIVVARRADCELLCLPPQLLWKRDKTF